MIGLTAPILLTFARLIQGFSAGGEWGSAAAFLVEWAPSNRRGLYGSVQALSTIVGVLLGSGVAALLSSALGKETIDAWAWRIPFLIGGVIGIVGLYMRSSVKETPVFRADAETATAGRQPNAWGLAARVFALSAIPHSFFYVGFAYFPTFVQTYAKLGRAEALWSNTIGLSSLIVLAPLAGLVSDRIGRRPMLIASALVMLVAPYLLVQALLSTPTLSTLLTVQLLFAAMHAVTGGCIHATFVEMLPTSLRLLIISSAYNLAGVVFGAFAPYFSVWIIRETGKPIAVSYLVIVAAVISGLGVIGLKETAGKPLR